MYARDWRKKQGRNCANFNEKLKCNDRKKVQRQKQPQDGSMGNRFQSKQMLIDQVKWHKRYTSIL